MTILNFLLRACFLSPLAIKDQKVSPSMKARGAADKATNSRATLVFPAPTGPESRTIGFISRSPHYTIAGNREACPSRNMNEDLQDSSCATTLRIERSGRETGGPGKI